MTAPSRPPSTLNRCCLGLANLGVCPHCVSGRQHPNPASPSLRYSPIERARRLITVAMWRPRDPDVNVAERSPTQTSVPEAWAEDRPSQPWRWRLAASSSRQPDVMAVHGARAHGASFSARLRPMSGRAPRRNGCRPQTNRITRVSSKCCHRWSCEKARTRQSVDQRLGQNRFAPRGTRQSRLVQSPGPRVQPSSLCHHHE